MPPPSSGGIVMLQVLNMLEEWDIASMGHNSAAKYHLLTEASRRAFADRAEYMADPDFADVPTNALTAKDYAADRRKGIDPKKASPSREVKFGEVAISEGQDTTHYTVVDPEGNVVSNTYTINDLYGSRVIGTGRAKQGRGWQKTFIVNDADDRSEKRWIRVVRGWGSRRAADHFRRNADGYQRDRPWHEHTAGD